MLPSRWTLLVFTLALLPFVATLGYGFLDWDDRMLLLDESRWRQAGWLGWILRDSSGGTLGPYQPLTWLSYRLDFALFGLDARGFHATNVALHGLTAAAFYGLLRDLLPMASSTLRDRARVVRAAAFVGALAWAVHPLRVEAVAWVTARRDVLNALLVVLSVRAWLAYVRGGARWTYAGSVLLFAAAMLAKSSAMGLPLVLLATGTWRLRRGSVRTRVVEVLPFFGIAGVVAAAAWAGQVDTGAMAVASPVERVVLASASAFQAVGDTLVPSGLRAHYLRPEPGAIVDAVRLLAVALVIATTVLSLGLRRRAPAFTVAWLAFLALLAPSSGLVPLGAHRTADRYAHLATLPLFAGATGAFALVLVRARAARAVGVVALAGVALLGAGAAWLVPSWTTTARLFERVVRLEPRNWLAFEMLGALAERAGDPDAAVSRFTEAVRLHPTPDARARLGWALVLADDDAAGERVLRDVLRESPRHVRSLVSLGALLGRRGDLGAAEASLRSAVESAPRDARARYNLAVVLVRTGRLPEAREHVRVALDVTPGYPDAVELGKRLALDTR